MIDNLVKKYKNKEPIKEDIIIDNFYSWFNSKKDNYKSREFIDFQIKRIVTDIEEIVYDECAPKTKVEPKKDPKRYSLSGCIFDRHGICYCEDSQYYEESCVNTCGEYYG